MTNPVGERLSLDEAACWPDLPLASWADTCATLHMWTQIVGKVRLALTPLVNHWWNVPLYVTPRGLTTSRIPYGHRAFELRFDFVAQQLVLETSEGRIRMVSLEPKSVADFYRECMAMLRAEGIEVKIWGMPGAVRSRAEATRERLLANQGLGALSAGDAADLGYDLMAKAVLAAEASPLLVACSL